MESEIEEIIIAISAILIGISAFIGFWMFLIAIISMIGGWTKLALKYKMIDKSKQPIKKYSFQSAQIGISNYGSVITFNVYKDGLGIKIMFLFKFKHPELFIPWNELKPITEEGSHFRWSKLNIGNPVITTLSVYTDFYNEIKSFMDKQSSVDDRW